MGDRDSISRSEGRWRTLEVVRIVALDACSSRTVHVREYESYQDIHCVQRAWPRSGSNALASVPSLPTKVGRFRYLVRLYVKVPAAEDVSHSFTTFPAVFVGISNQATLPQHEGVLLTDRLLSDSLCRLVGATAEGDQRRHYGR